MSAECYAFASQMFIFILCLLTINQQSIMNCLINNTIDSYLRKGRKVEVVKRYIRMKYRVHIDSISMTKRVQMLNLEY